MKLILTAIMFFLIITTAPAQEIPKWKITDVEKMMSSKNAGILVLNFWATFCKPCVAEIPFFIKVAGKYKDDRVKLILISLDLPSYYPEKISSFAKKNKFYTDISWLQETNADYFCPKIDSSWSGSIPATLIVNTKTGTRRFFEGEIEEKTLEEALKSVLE